MQQRAVIIGGGITGTLTALQLAEKGHDVTLLEGRHLGAGSSSRTAGGIRAQFSTPGTVLGMMYAKDYYTQLQGRLGERVLWPNGYLFLQNHDQWQGAQSRVEMQRGLGLDVEALPIDDLLHRFPWLRPSEEVQPAGGTWCGSDGFLNPPAIYQGAAELATGSGARIVQNAQVVGALLRGGRLTAVDTSKGRFAGDVFLDATNAWTNCLAAMIGARRLEVEALRRHLWYAPRTDALAPDVLAGMPLLIGPSGVYCRPDGPDKLMYAKLPAHTYPEYGALYEDQDRVYDIYDHSRASDLSHPPFAALMELAELVPAFGEFGAPTATTSGYYATTPDHNPFLDFDPDIKNLIRLAGFSGHGAMFGPFTALVASALIAAGQSLDSVTLPDGRGVSPAPFRIGRRFESHESLVI